MRKGFVGLRLVAVLVIEAKVVGDLRRHAGRALGRLHFDRGDFGVRAVRAQEIAVELPREVPVRGVFALPREEPQILSPALETRTHRFISGWDSKARKAASKLPRRTVRKEFGTGQSSNAGGRTACAAPCAHGNPV